jgi:hypothetical protein
LKLNVVRELAKANIIHLSNQIDDQPTNIVALCQYINCFRNILDMDFFDKINSYIFINYLLHEAETNGIDVINWIAYRKMKINKILLEI